MPGGGGRQEPLDPLAELTLAADRCLLIRGGGSSLVTIPVASLPPLLLGDRPPAPQTSGTGLDSFLQGL